MASIEGKPIVLAPFYFEDECYLYIYIFFFSSMFISFYLCLYEVTPNWSNRLTFRLKKKIQKMAMGGGISLQKNNCLMFLITNFPGWCFFIPAFPKIALRRRGGGVICILPPPITVLVENDK